MNFAWPSVQLAVEIITDQTKAIMSLSLVGYPTHLIKELILKCLENFRYQTVLLVASNGPGYTGRLC